MQIIFILNSTTISVSNNTGWVMIAICIANTFINFIIWIVYNLQNKIRNWRNKVKIQDDNQGIILASEINFRPTTNAQNTKIFSTNRELATNLGNINIRK